MGPVAGVVGVAVIGVALWDTFETVVLPRRVTRRLRPARLLFKSLWKLWLLVAAVIRRPGRRESFLSLFGPFSLIVLLGGWSMMLLLGFALVHSALGLQIAVPERPPTFFTALYLSGTTLFTLGLADVVPTSAAARAVTRGLDDPCYDAAGGRVAVPGAGCAPALTRSRPAAGRGPAPAARGIARGWGGAADRRWGGQEAGGAAPFIRAVRRRFGARA